MAVLTHTHDIAAAAARTQKTAATAFRKGRDATADVLETAADRINAGADRLTTVAHDTAVISAIVLGFVSGRVFRRD